MLSLSPRTDLYRFMLPDEFLPEEVDKKYKQLINKDAAVFTEPIDYLNESIQSITIPGISDINIEQNQTSTNPIIRSNGDAQGMGRINREPSHPNTYVGTNNPLEKINREFSISFRRNQNLYNYFMIYETIFHRVCKHINYNDGDFFKIYLLNEDGVATSYIELQQCHINGIDGLEFDFSKVDRQADTFSVTWNFNNINFEFIDIEKVN